MENKHIDGSLLQVLQKGFARVTGSAWRRRSLAAESESAGRAASDTIEALLTALDVPFDVMPDGRIVAHADVNLSDRGLLKLPDMTAVIVHGNFTCSRNALVSLEGSPQVVTGGYFCDRNALRDLRGAPETINQSFNCNANPDLESLRGGPKNVRINFRCENNPKLRALDGAPETFENVMSDFGTYNLAQGIPEDVLTPPHVRAAREMEKLVHSKRIRAATTVITATEIAVPRLKIPAARR